MTVAEKRSALVERIQEKEQELGGLASLLRRDERFRTGDYAVGWNDWSKEWVENIPGPWQQTWNNWKQPWANR